MATKKWAEIRRRRSPDEEAAITAAKERARHEMRLADIRRARALTQATLAEAMGVPQGEVSKIEHRQDVYMSTLRRFIEALGAELVVAARFPDGDIPIRLSDDQPA